MMLSSRLAKRAIRSLRKREDWLTDRIVLSHGDLSYDKAERSALQFSIGVLTALLDGQKVEVSHGRSRTRLSHNQAETGEAYTHEQDTKVPGEVSPASIN